MKSLFNYKETFYDKIDISKLVEKEPNAFWDKKTDKIYAMSFGAEEYIQFEDFEDYSSKNGKIMFFSINSVRSSFKLLSSNEVKEIVSKMGIGEEVLRINRLEAAYLLPNGDILFTNNRRSYGELYKNLEELQIIKS